MKPIEMPADVEYHLPDAALAYAQIAPLVAESHAYAQAGMDKLAMIALASAKKAIDEFSRAVALSNQIAATFSMQEESHVDH